MLAEPSGIVVPTELRNAVLSAGRGGVVIEPGPVLLLLDATSPDSAFGEGVGDVSRYQVEQSDAVVLTKIDRADSDSVTALEKIVREIAPETPILQVSLTEARGTTELLALLA